MAQGLDSLPLLATLPHPKVVVVELVEQCGEAIIDERNAQQNHTTKVLACLRSMPILSA